MKVESVSSMTLLLSDTSGLCTLEAEPGQNETIHAISARFWANRCGQLMRDLQRLRREGMELRAALEEVLTDTAANITICVERPDDLIVATSWNTHGMYWTRLQSGRLVLSDQEAQLAASTGRVKLAASRVVRYLHDDANISPLGSLFEGISRIPGGVCARFTPAGSEPSVSPRPLATSLTSSQLDASFAAALDTTASEIVQQAAGGLIYAQISGGIDGLVVLTSLVAQGGRVLAVYGDDGEEQHQINQQVVEALGRRFPAAKLDYHWIRAGEIPEAELLAAQAQRCSQMIKGNYLKRHYKLALADAAAFSRGEAPVCVVNGYGVDELYSGCKGDASLSTIHPLSPGLALARLVGSWRTTAPGLRWLWLQHCWLRWGSRSEKRLQAALIEHLILAGKAGGSLGSCAREELSRRFRKALIEDGESLSGLLGPLLGKRPSQTRLACYCKRFIYGLVEQTHLVRFAAHGNSAQTPYILPFEAGRVRQVLEAHIASIQEIWQPKLALVRYLSAAGVDYIPIIRGVTRTRAGGRKHLRVALAKIKASLKQLAGPLIRLSRKQPDRSPARSLDCVLRQVRHRHPPSEEIASLLDELRAITGRKYVDDIEAAIANGSTDPGSFSTKQVYNYVHLISYVLAARRAVL